MRSRFVIRAMMWRSFEVNHDNPMHRPPDIRFDALHDWKTGKGISGDGEPVDALPLFGSTT